MLEGIINPYLRFVIFLVASFVILRTLVFIFRKVIIKLTTKTKTNFDDILVSRIKNPLTILVFLVSILISIKELPLAINIFSLVQKIVYSLIIIEGSYLVFTILKVVTQFGSQKFSGKIKAKKSQGLINLINSTINVLFVIVALLLILDFWGVEITPLLTGLGIGGIAIAFALQNSLGNIFGGISIIMDKSIEVGDLVSLDKGEIMGKIMKIGLRSTKIKTFDNELLIIPNSKLADGVIHNIAMPEPKSRVVIPFGVAYGSNIEKVKEIVMKEIKKVKHFVDDPEPAVMFLSMGDSSLNFKAFFFVDSFENRFAATDEANTRIYKALNKAKINIPFPQMDVHLKK